MSTNPHPHILVFPYPAQGHITTFPCIFCYSSPTILKLTSLTSSAYPFTLITLTVLLTWLLRPLLHSLLTWHLLSLVSPCIGDLHWGPSSFLFSTSPTDSLSVAYPSQVSILNHKAVGAFLSHCGWNSVLEGVVGGVMIMAWPMEAEQYVNARLLVDDMGVGVRVCEGADSVPDADELGRAIAESMTEGAGVKAKAKDLQQKALAAMSDGGSSMKDLDTFVEELGKLGRRY